MATQTQEKTGSEQQIQGETQETRYERGLKKMSEVYGVPDNAVLEPLVRPEECSRDLTGGQADSEPERR